MAKKRKTLTRRVADLEGNVRTKAGIMANILARLDKLDDQYNGLGGSHDGLMRTVAELAKRVDGLEGRATVQGDRVFKDAMQVTLLRERVEELKTLEAMRVAEELENLRLGLIGRAWRAVRNWLYETWDAPEPTSDYNARHPLKKEKSTPADGWTHGAKPQAGDAVCCNGYIPPAPTISCVWTVS